jgi:hypothetical protein
MRFHLPSIASLFAAGILLALAAWQPFHKPDQAGYLRCTKLYPERHCAVTYLGAR